MKPSLGSARESWKRSWRDLGIKLAPHCHSIFCKNAGSVWRRMRHRSRGVQLQDLWYCSPECLEIALRNGLPVSPRPARQVPAAAHRMPLGLLLLSRDQLTPEQLRAGLETQQSAGHGRIGEWLQTLGFVSEQQVTAALARQWSCPVLRIDSAAWQPTLFPEIPLFLLESFQMIPVDFVKVTATLHIAFSESIDYRVLYALEQMLRCRTVPCLVKPSILRRSLASWPEHCKNKESVFDRITDAAEFARIIRSYSATVRASQVRVAPCAEYTWVRLERNSDSLINLLFRAPRVESTRI